MQNGYQFASLRKTPHKRLNAKGFSLIELMIVVAIAGITLALALPDLTNFVKNSRIDRKSNELVTAIALTRQAAIARGQTVFVCHTNNADQASPTCSGGTDSNWSTGYIVYAAPAGTLAGATRNYVDGTDVLINQVDLADDDSVTVVQGTGANVLAYSNRGLPITAFSTLTICDDRTAETGMQISISPAGRVNSEEFACA